MALHCHLQTIFRAVSNFSKPAAVVEVVHHHHCCAYHHRARPGHHEYFDEFYNRTKLDRCSLVSCALVSGLR